MVQQLLICENISVNTTDRYGCTVVFEISYISTHMRVLSRIIYPSMERFHWVIFDLISTRLLHIYFLTLQIRTRILQVTSKVIYTSDLPAPLSFLPSAASSPFPITQGTFELNFKAPFFKAQFHS